MNQSIYLFNVQAFTREVDSDARRAALMHGLKCVQSRGKINQEAFGKGYLATSMLHIGS